MTDYLPIRFFTFIRYWRKNWNQLFIDLKKVYDVVRREVLYNILIEFVAPMKLLRLSRMCLHQM